MIEPIVSLAFSIYSNKGVYALLIGSGVSRGAEIPTGWEIVEDLVRKYSAVIGEDCGEDCEVWYKETTGNEPNYSELIKTIGKKQSERQALLRSYFEPDEEEREQGIKVPTLAHRAIAELVSKGFIKVIVTTNFDKLIEKELEEKGINPVVISNEDDIKGAPPLPHNEVVLIKINGDYTDIRIRNTPEELNKYPKELEKLLDRVFDEYGLIVSGWSGEWDIALRKALERCKSHRFTTFWTARREPEETAKKIIRLRKAEVIHINDANSFFEELKEKVIAIRDYSKPHPLSVEAAKTSIKKFLSDDKYEITAHDLVVGEATKLKNINESEFSVKSSSVMSDDFVARVKKYEGVTAILLNLFVTGCYWSKKAHYPIWSKCLELVGNPSDEKSGLCVWLELKYYPALLLLYGGGLAALSAGKYELLWMLFADVTISESDRPKICVLKLNPLSVFHSDSGKALPGLERRLTPVSDYLSETLRPLFIEIIPSNSQYELCFDKFEYLLGLTYFYFGKTGWAPIGCFGWRGTQHGGLEPPIIRETQLDIERTTNEWPPLKQGFFDGDYNALSETKLGFDDFIRSHPLR